MKYADQLNRMFVCDIEDHVGWEPFHATEPQVDKFLPICSKIDLFNANRWYEWGPYLAERAWGTVREDYSG